MFIKKLKNVFPTSFSIAIFILYMALFINQGLLVTASQKKDKSYYYNTKLVVLITEILKLIFSFTLYCRSERCATIFQTLKGHSRLIFFYMVPSLLYCLYNNLAFHNLSQYDPTSYFILLQLRVVITAVLFQCLFKKSLSILQWVSFAILTAGCIVKNFSALSQHKEASSWALHTFVRYFFSTSTLLIIVQVFCSCLAGVYNEKLLKHIGTGLDVLGQNIFMCLDSIFFNAVILLATENFESVFAVESFQQIMNMNVVVIIFNNAAIGIVTAFFLKSLNSVVKNYASALELIFTAVLSRIFFGIRIDMWTVLSIALVISATVLYVHNPVVNPSLEEEKEESNKKDADHASLMHSKLKNVP